MADRAADHDSPILVALKFLAAHAIEEPEHKARFVREAKAAARVDHPNICPVYEIDEADGQTFLAIWPYCDNPTSSLFRNPLILGFCSVIPLHPTQEKRYYRLGKKVLSIGKKGTTEPLALLGLPSHN